MARSAERHDIFCAETRAGACGVVIFGASGDLTKRKLLPALFNLHRRSLLPDEFFLVGFARTEYTDDAFRGQVVQALSVAGFDTDTRKAKEFVSACHYCAGQYDRPDDFLTLRDRIAGLTADLDTPANVLFYVSTPPSVYESVATHLDGAGLTDEQGGTRWRRLLIEKPFGHDYASAVALERHLLERFSEEQVYRIDHYLGKDTVQNILVLRFANGIFEPLWNRHSIDHVQITVAEDIGIEHRAGITSVPGCYATCSRIT